MRHKGPHRLQWLVFLVGVLALGWATPAYAAGTGSIDHVEAQDGTVRVLYSIPAATDDTQPDLRSVKMSVNGVPLQATATSASSGEGIERTTILAIDVSNSMRGNRFAQAKLAAEAFLDVAPPDLKVGIVAFAGSVDVLQQPSTDRATTRQVINDLSLSSQTLLYDGLTEAVRVAGDEGQRGVLLLSDGKDTSSTRLSDVVATVKDAELKVDVVALEQSSSETAPLEQIASAGEGSVVTADDPEALTKVFADEAEALARQVLVTAKLPAELAGSQGSLAVALNAAGETYADTAFVTLGDGSATGSPARSEPLPVVASGLSVSKTLMLGGLAALGLGMVVLLAVLFTGGQQKPQTLEDRIAAYSRTGDPRAAAPQPGARRAPVPSPGVAGQAVEMAQKALASNRNFEAALAAKLDAASLQLKPAEWLLVHAGIAVLAGLVGLLLSSGGLLLTLLFLLLGAVLPWIYLGLKKSRRLKAFESQLADVLQLMAGSLSAGLSLAQSVDTVVREGSDPVAGELKRALTETRLGVSVEDALESVAHRMQSDDFHWVVMAIRIQREVGGNLSELLLNVAATLREREYMRRQVKALSAEGRLSAWILGGLPPGFVGYLALTNPEYLKPMLDSMLGWVMIGFASVMMVVGAFWLSKMVKVEV